MTYKILNYLNIRFPTKKMAGWCFSVFGTAARLQSDNQKQTGPSVNRLMRFLVFCTQGTVWQGITADRAF